jgi:hypothetical protein
MGNSNSAPNNSLNSDQENALSKLETILGGSDTETYVANQNNNHLLNKFNKLMTDSDVNNKYNAVTGDTETLENFIQPESTINHGVFETTSEEIPFTISENLVPVVRSSYLMNGGYNSNDTLSKLSNLLQDSESNFTGNASNDNIVNKLSSLLENTETNDYAVNFRGGNLDSENLFTSEDINGGKYVKSEESAVHVKSEESAAHVKSEESVANVKSEESEQSGGVELDSELKNILMTLKKENANKNNNVISGGKTKKGSKKSKKSKKSKSSRRTATSAVDSDNDDSDEYTDSGSSTEEYLTSTSSLNTSDINVKHYR